MKPQNYILGKMAHFSPSLIVKIHQSGASVMILIIRWRRPVISQTHAESGSRKMVKKFLKNVF